jgi:outer membrane biogenesis lipoprotein LolB
MKKHIVFIIALCAAASLNACKNEQVKNTGTADGSTSSSQDQQVDLRQFEQEGFTSRDSFRVIIVQPSDSAMTLADVTKQAHTKAMLSLKRHITSSGKSLSQNTDASLLNLINGSGKLTPYKDSARTIYVMEISKPGCKGYVESLGK